MKGYIKLYTVETAEGDAIAVECRVKGVDLVDKAALLHGLCTALHMGTSEKALLFMGELEGFADHAIRQKDHTEVDMSQVREIGYES